MYLFVNWFHIIISIQVLVLQGSLTKNMVAWLRYLWHVSVAKVSFREFFFVYNIFFTNFDLDHNFPCLNLSKNLLFFLCSSVKVNDVRWPIAPQTVSPNGPIKWWVLFSFFFFYLVDPSNRFFFNHCLFWYHIYWIIITFLKKTPKVNWWNLTKTRKKKKFGTKTCWAIILLVTKGKIT